MTTPSDDRPDPDETRPLASPSSEGPGGWAPYSPPFEPRPEAGPAPSAGGPTYPPAPTPPGAYPVVHPGGHAGGYLGPHPGYHPVGYAQSHGGATTSMVLGIIAVSAAVLAPFTCCFSLPLALTGPVAIGIAVSAQRQIDARPGAYRNRGNATAGLVTGIIGTLLGLVLFVLVALFVGSLDTNLYT